MTTFRIFLVILEKFVTTNIPNAEVLCDVVVSDNKVMTDSHKDTVPPDILITNLRPDLTVIDRGQRKIVIVELTVPFERNFIAAKERKADKYAPLLAGLEEGGYMCKYFSLELGARGIASNGTFKTLKSITGATRKSVCDLMKNLSQTVIKCSYVIFRAKDCDDPCFDFIFT